MYLKKLHFFILFVGIVLFLTSSVSIAHASHSWGGFHWGRTSNPFTLKLGNNLSSNWISYLGTTSSDWNASSILDTTIVTGKSSPRNCRATSGQIEVCNNKFGKNGWLGLAQIWISGDHIIQGVTKLNDTYFNTAKYNVPAWKNLVMCQEVGHTLGLDHQDEAFDNLNLDTCMDYTNDPSTNQHPNAHDYEELEIIYSHLDSITTISQTKASIASGNFDNSRDWGKQRKNNGRVALYERDFGGGHKLFTFIIWAQE